MQFFRKIFNKIGWTGIIIIILFIFFAIRGFLQKSSLQKKSAYTKGVINGISTGAKGSKYLDYTFNASMKNFTGSEPIAFCKKCNDCCEVGDSVIVNYQRDNPENNDLVAKLPNGAVLENAPQNILY